MMHVGTVKGMSYCMQVDTLYMNIYSSIPFALIYKLKQQTIITVIIQTMKRLTRAPINSVRR